jgi:hypothetical protein
VSNDQLSLLIILYFLYFFDFFDFVVKDLDAGAAAWMPLFPLLSANGG